MEVRLDLHENPKVRCTPDLIEFNDMQAQQPTMSLDF